jgi:hypothetical protein
MATQYSDWFNTTQPATSITFPRIKVPFHKNTKYRKTAKATLTVTDFTTDVCRMLTVKPNDVLNAMWISSNGASTVTTVDVGIYISGLAHDGAVVDADEFAAASAVNGGLNRSEIMLSAGATVVSRRGMAVWEIAGYADEAAARLAAGPAGTFDICLTGVASVTTANEIVVLEVEGTFS